MKKHYHNFSVGFLETPHLTSYPERSPLQKSSDTSFRCPALPQHLDKLIDSPWTPEATRQVDLWFWYCQQEFELVGAYE